MAHSHAAGPHDDKDSDSRANDFLTVGKMCEGSKDADIRIHKDHGTVGLRGMAIGYQDMPTHSKYWG